MLLMSHDLTDLLDDDKENSTHTHTGLDMAAAVEVSFLKHLVFGETLRLSSFPHHELLTQVVTQR